MQLKVKLTKYINDKIVNYYTELYNKRLKRYPNDRSYTKQQLLQNIRNAKSINNSTITDNDITQPTYTPWINNGWKEIKANNWHYAIILLNDGKGAIIAKGQDAHHKNDNHNNTMQTQPYTDESVIKIANLIERMNKLYM